MRSFSIEFVKTDSARASIDLGPQVDVVGLSRYELDRTDITSPNRSCDFASLICEDTVQPVSEVVLVRILGAIFETDGFPGLVRADLITYVELVGGFAINTICASFK